MEMVSQTITASVLRVDLFAAYRDKVSRAKEKARRKWVRSGAFTLTYVGFICLGVAVAPFAPVVQWYTATAIEKARVSVPMVVQKFHREEAAAYGMLPTIHNKKDVLTTREQAVALVGEIQEESAVRAAVAAAITVRAPGSTPESNETSTENAVLAGSKKTVNVTANRVVIPKIKVDMPIIEGSDATRALLKGAWRIPGTSMPDKGGNTVLSGHRFLYTKGPNVGKNFFHLDKLEEGDEIIVYWQGKEYHYRMRSTKVVTPKEVSILNNTKESILTLFTCTPLYSSSHRLVQVAELIDVKSRVYPVTAALQ